ncbi:hypothetical protein O3P69_017348 [Scylla paramamosain]|uniref:Uncharacterized protein n=1 Tax=Scylla paramamosain TaxID=85552 RepID=A0AAW0TVG2_SCYPA
MTLVTLKIMRQNVDMELSGHFRLCGGFKCDLRARDPPSIDQPPRNQNGPDCNHSTVSVHPLNTGGLSLLSSREKETAHIILWYVNTPVNVPESQKDYHWSSASHPPTHPTSQPTSHQASQPASQPLYTASRRRVQQSVAPRVYERAVVNQGCSSQRRLGPNLGRQETACPCDRRTVRHPPPVAGPPHHRLQQRNPGGPQLSQAGAFILSVSEQHGRFPRGSLARGGEDVSHRRHNSPENARTLPSGPRLATPTAATSISFTRIPPHSCCLTRW